MRTDRFKVQKKGHWKAIRKYILPIAAKVLKNFQPDYGNLHGIRNIYHSITSVYEKWNDFKTWGKYNKQPRWLRAFDRSLAVNYTRF